MAAVAPCPRAQVIALGDLLQLPPVIKGVVKGRQSAPAQMQGQGAAASSARVGRGADYWGSDTSDDEWEDEQEVRACQYWCPRLRPCGSRGSTLQFGFRTRCMREPI